MWSYTGKVTGALFLQITGRRRYKTESSKCTLKWQNNYMYEVLYDSI